MSLRQVAGRRDGAIRTLEAAGRIAADLHVVETAALQSRLTMGRAQVAELPAGRRPTAMFCANDLLALDALQEMTSRQIRVPGSIAIVGYDDIDFAAAAAVPLTSVRESSSNAKPVTGTVS